MTQRMQCGYCLGEAVLDDDDRWKHGATTVAPPTTMPGDYVTRRHHAGTVVLAVDLVEWEDEAA